MQKDSPRNEGVDIARILAMFLVCILHAGGWWKGMAYAPTVLDRAAAVTYWSFAYVAVDLFMLITGYLGIRRNWKFKSLLRLWYQVAFYLLGGFLLAYIIDPHCCSLSYFWENIFPIPLANGYWYFTAYAGAFFLFPYLNKGFLCLTKQEREKLLLTLFIVICCFGFYNKHVWGGFNAVWMLVMYLAGAYFKLHPINLRTRHLLCIYSAASLIGGLIFALATHLKHTQGFILPLPGLDYTSPFTVCAAIALFLACIRTTPQAAWLRKALQWMAPLTFAVYLIQTHPTLNCHFSVFAAWLGSYTHYSWWHMPLCATAVFILGICVDYLRVLLFNGIAKLARLDSQQK